MARTSSLRWLMFIGVAGAFLAATGCGSGSEKKSTADVSQFQPVDAAIDGSAEPAAAAKNAPPATPQTKATKPAAITVDRLDEESMPDGPPAAILAYMKRLDSYEPRGITRDAQRADLVRVKRLGMDAADLALSHPEATPDERKEAAAMKLASLTELVQLGEPKADQELIAFCARLKKDRTPEVAHIGRTMMLNVDVAKLQNGDLEDPQPVYAELLALLEGPDDDHLIFMIGSQAATVFSQLGHRDIARATFVALGKRYADDPNEEVAQEAKNLAKQIKLIDLNFREYLIAAFGEKAPKAGAIEQLVGAVTALLKTKDLGEMEFQVAMQTADMLERTEQLDAAAQILDAIEATYANFADEEIAADAAKTVAAGRKRMALLGRSLPLGGQTLDGQPFDPTTLRGKVVLIDFWATWCEPCLAEIPNIKKYYALYKDKGFEVIGYNLDKERKNVNAFFATQRLPWPTVVSDDPERIGLASPLAEACGVKSIPLLVLIDQQGKVVALHPQGDKLGEKLAELLGPADEAAASTPAAETGERLVPRKTLR